ncbi:MAG: ParB/RepB/Spo0J family partition protein [Candidatus Aminicenantes bacterium]|nr:ParB/RepB/Spo0J family partition protein [Candidatus Aminicenantes bacterium]
MQKTRKSGLPESIGMRHDTHFVELISKKSSGPIVRMLSIDKIEPNPHQPRNELGNIEELMASIKAKGVLEPIIVRPKGDRYEIIAGERRYLASKNIGLNEIPAIEMSVSDSEALEISLIENLQRKDLDFFEEADGLNALIDLYDYSHAQVSEKIGKGRSTITEILSLSKIPASIRSECREFQIDKNRSLLVEISKLKSEIEMRSLIDQIKNRGLKREDTRDLTKLLKGKTLEKARTKNYVFNYSPREDRSFSLKIEFKKEHVGRAEIIKVLEDLLQKLKAS